MKGSFCVIDNKYIHKLLYKNSSFIKQKMQIFHQKKYSSDNE